MLLLKINCRLNVYNSYKCPGTSCSTHFFTSKQNSIVIFLSDNALSFLSDPLYLFYQFTRYFSHFINFTILRHYPSGYIYCITINLIYYESIYEEMINLTKEAKALTTAHKIQQEQFEIITK